MKYNIICKLDPAIRRMITYTWNRVYKGKDLDRQAARYYIMGILFGLRRADCISIAQEEALWNYYSNWFSF